MKAIVERADFTDAISSVTAVLPVRSTQPILANVLLSASGNNLTAVGTDKEQSLYVSIPAEVPVPGSFAVPAKKLGDILREMDNGDVEIILDENHLSIIQGKRKIRLPGVPADEFPQTDLLKSPQKPFQIEPDILLELMNLTAYAISTEITRMNLSGLLWQIFPNEMRMVATDGHKLALVKKKMETDFSSPVELLIPERAVTKLMGILSKVHGETISVTTGDGSIQFEMDSYRFQSKLITEKFPDYERVLPTENDAIMIADTQELTQAVKLMSVISSAITNLVKFSFSKGSLELFASDLDAGTEGSSAISVDYEGEPFSIGFSSKMLLDVLRHIPSEQVRFAMKDATIACLVTPMPQPEEYEYTTVIMPLRLNEYNS